MVDSLTGQRSPDFRTLFYNRQNGAPKISNGRLVAAGVVDLVVHGGRALSIAFDILWGAGQMALGVGILRLRPAARLIALIYCWFTFALFPFVLVSWCIWPHSTSIGAFIYVAALAAINPYFYIIFRSTEIRALFHLVSSRPL